MMSSFKMMTTDSEQVLNWTLKRWLFTDRHQYDVSPDGQRFLINTLVQEEDRSVTLVLNGFEELRERVPVPCLGASEEFHPWRSRDA